MAVKIAINGAAGRMGRLLIDLIAQSEDVILSAAYEHDKHDLLGQDAGVLINSKPLGVNITSIPNDITDDVKNNIDVIIDFSLPVGLKKLLDSFKSNPIALVSGTTGLSDAIKAELKELSTKVPIICAPNFSTGVNLLLKLAADATKGMGDGVDIEIVEFHHKHKKDAPSGTAVNLARTLADVIETDDIISGRDGDVGERPKKQIGVHAVRGGEVVGEHTVYLYGLGETLELTHKASGREAFAKGAINAAKFIYSKPAREYSMKDVLGL